MHGGDENAGAELGVFGARQLAFALPLVDEAGEPRGQLAEMRLHLRGDLRRQARQLGAEGRDAEGCAIVSDALFPEADIAGKPPVGARACAAIAAIPSSVACR